MGPHGFWYSLRHFDEAPQLPTGYFGMFLVAFCPPLWFRVMDSRVIAHCGPDAEAINIDPDRREELIARYGLERGAA